jgi:hypothetical protein
MALKARISILEAAYRGAVLVQMIIGYPTPMEM